MVINLKWGRNISNSNQDLVQKFVYLYQSNFISLKRISKRVLLNSFNVLVDKRIFELSDLWDSYILKITNKLILKQCWKLWFLRKHYMIPTGLWTAKKSSKYFFIYVMEVFWVFKLNLAVLLDSESSNSLFTITWDKMLEYTYSIFLFTFLHLNMLFCHYSSYIFYSIISTDLL